MTDKFSYWENYISMFLFLDKVYEENKHFDDLGGLLGSIDPYLFTDNTPADSALLKDWLDITGGERTNISFEAGFNNMSSFIKLEQKNFSIDLKELIDYLEEVKINPQWETWIMFCTKSKQQITR